MKRARHDHHGIDWHILQIEFSKNNTWTHWYSVAHCGISLFIYKRQFFGGEIVEPELWNFLKVGNNVFYNARIIFNEWRKRYCESTFIFVTSEKKSHLQSIRKSFDDHLALVSQTLSDAVTLWNCGICKMLWKILCSERNLNIRLCRGNITCASLLCNTHSRKKWTFEHNIFPCESRIHYIRLFAWFSKILQFQKFHNCQFPETNDFWITFLHIVRSPTIVCIVKHVYYNMQLQGTK